MWATKFEGADVASSITRVTLFYYGEVIKYIKGLILALVVNIFYTYAGYFLTLPLIKSTVFSRKG